MGKPVRTVRVAPSLLAADLARLADEVQAVEQAGADLLHLDVMDGSFVPNLTFGPPLCAALRRVTSLPLDVHLMVVQPEKLISAFAQAGANRLAVHVEACVHLHRTLEEIRQQGMAAGLALNPLTPLGQLEEVWPFVDFILLMTVNPGFGGQAFIPQMLQKLARLAQWRDQRRPEVELAVDGGVDASNAPQLIAAGADILVAGTAVFSAADRKLSVIRLRGGSRCAEDLA